MRHVVVGDGVLLYKAYAAFRTMLYTKGQDWLGYDVGYLGVFRASCRRTSRFVYTSQSRAFNGPGVKVADDRPGRVPVALCGVVWRNVCSTMMSSEWGMAPTPARNKQHGASTPPYTYSRSCPGLY